MKVKVGIGDDAGRLAAVRAAVGPGVAIRADANGAWGSPREALANLRALAPVGLELCEEPVHGLEALREVRAESPVPIAIDESAAEPGAAGAGAADAVCLKISRCGGIGGVLRDAEAARAAGAAVYVASTFDGPLGIAAGLHAAAALRATRRAAPVRARHARRVRGRRRPGAARRQTRATPRAGPARRCDPGPMSTEILRYAAFTDRPEGGNPAGVVLDASGLDDAAMQAIAADVGYSETAFVTAADGSDLVVRYFSPLAEVPFCGHATIATGVAWGERFGDGVLQADHAGRASSRSTVADGVAKLTSVSAVERRAGRRRPRRAAGRAGLGPTRTSTRRSRRASPTRARTTPCSPPPRRSGSPSSTTTSTGSAR